MMRVAYVRALMACIFLASGCVGLHAGETADDSEAPYLPGLPPVKSFAGILETNSEPDGAEVTTSLGGSCRTPCSLEVFADGPFTVTFTREGYLPSTVQVKIQRSRPGVSERKFEPNQIFAQLVAVPPPPAPEPPAKKRAGQRVQSPGASTTNAAKPTAASMKPTEKQNAAKPQGPAAPAKTTANAAGANSQAPAEESTAQRWLDRFNRRASDPKLCQGC